MTHCFCKFEGSWNSLNISSASLGYVFLKIFIVTRALQIYDHFFFVKIIEISTMSRNRTHLIDFPTWRISKYFQFQICWIARCYAYYFLIRVHECNKKIQFLRDIIVSRLYIDLFPSPTASLYIIVEWISHCIPIHWTTMILSILTVGIIRTLNKWCIYFYWPSYSNKHMPRLLVHGTRHWN